MTSIYPTFNWRSRLLVGLSFSSLAIVIIQPPMGAVKPGDPSHPSYDAWSGGHYLADAGHGHGESHGDHDSSISGDSIEHHHDVDHDEQGDAHDTSTEHSGGHHHGALDISSASSIPSLDLIVHNDPVGGWNLELVTENFDFAPERVNGDSLIHEGHAHLYINGEKIMRIYANWHHLPALEPGTNEITVTLNANGHEELVYQGEVVADTVVISVP